MFLKRRRAYLPGLALAAYLILLSGCGWKTPSGQTSQAAPSKAQDQVRITLHLLIPPNKREPVVTLTDASLVHQLYTTVVALPLQPPVIACTNDLGPSYTLTFLRGGKTLLTATAQRYGCGVISLMGQKQDRLANQAFWSQLDQAIYQASPPASQQSVAILHMGQPDQPSQTAQITSVETVQRLYKAILALPLIPRSDSCIPSLLPEYQLVFHAPDQAIPALLDSTCNTITLQGNYQSRGGTFVMNSQFKQLFQQTLATVTFAPALPNQLTVDVEPESGTASFHPLTDAGLLLQLYNKIFALPLGKALPNCPPQSDKIAGKGRWYMLNFTQWDLPVLPNVDAFEGSCLVLFLDAGQATGGGPVLQADAEVWDLVHRAASS
jgi:hypothetical protein